MYQITVKAYDGSIPVQTGSWSPEAGESVRDMEQIPVRVTCTWDRASRTDRFRIRAEALEDLTFPVSVSLERVEEKWTRNEYVFMPAAVYYGNRMESRKIPYPPYCGEKTETGWREVIHRYSASLKRRRKPGYPIPVGRYEHAGIRILFTGGQNRCPFAGKT